jgi:hypothetical protein
MARAQRLRARLPYLRRWLAINSPLLNPRSGSSCLPLWDAFSDSNGVNLSAHLIAPDNPGSLAWSKVGTSNVTIQSDKAQTAGINGWYVLDPQAADLQASGKFTPATSSDGYLGIIARYEDASHYWRIGINVTDRMRIVEVNGGETVRAAGTPVIDQGVEYSLAANLDGVVINATLDGGSPLAYSSATFQQSSTKHGLLLRFSGDTVDDFKLEALT